jgi:hypothetical protein
MDMKWRHWSILIVLLLLNYIIFSTAFTQLSRQSEARALPTRTPLPTFQSQDAMAVSWIVLPTSTPLPTRTPFTPMPTETLPPTAVVTSTMPILETPASEAPVDSTEPAAPPEATVAPTEVPATATPEPQPTDTAQPAPTKTPAPKPTKKPPTATPKPTARGAQFTAQVSWDPNTAPNCAGPGISKASLIHDAAGNPINGLVVEANCYGNLYRSQPSGTPGEYDPGRYGFGFGQNSPMALTCTAYILGENGQPMASSQMVTIAFDTNDCKPGGSGHQVATVNWTKHW